MYAKKYLSVIGMTCLMLLACACGVVIRQGSGNIITETRQVSGFDAVVFSGAGHIEIIQDGSESITIATDDDVMPYVETEVRAGTLYVGLDFGSLRTITPTEMNITLHVDALESIETSGAWDVASEALEADSLQTLISGAGSITIDKLTADSLEGEISGAGDMELGGTVTSLQLNISGTGKLRAGDLHSDTAVIEISGAADAQVWAEKSLSAIISGTGKLEYYGNPQLSVEQSGTAEITSLGEK